MKTFSFMVLLIAKTTNKIKLLILISGEPGMINTFGSFNPFTVDIEFTGDT